VVTIRCRLVCVAGFSQRLGRSLLLLAAQRHGASRVEATIDGCNSEMVSWWTGLGFYVHESTAVVDEIEKLDRSLGGGLLSGGGPSSASGSVQTSELDMDTAPVDLHEEEEPASPATLEAPHAEWTKRVYIRKTCPGADNAHLVKVAPGVALSDEWESEWADVPEERLGLPITVRCNGCQLRVAITRESALEMAE